MKAFELGWPVPSPSNAYAIYFCDKILATPVIQNQLGTLTFSMPQTYTLKWSQLAVLIHVGLIFSHTEAKLCGRSYCPLEVIGSSTELAQSYHFPLFSSASPLAFSFLPSHHSSSPRPLDHFTPPSA